jgi:uncharacterized membrane protein YqjE
MNTLAASFSVSGVHGFLILIAFLLFAVAAIIAWVVQPRAVWATFVAAGLALFMLAQLITG